MSADCREAPTVLDAIYEMESDILDVKSWAMAFQTMASSGERIDPAVINVMADALYLLGTRLKENFTGAVEIGRKLE